jgi:hypothetical protein
MGIVSATKVYEIYALSISVMGSQQDIGRTSGENVGILPYTIKRTNGWR